jgi:hypothetical protein
MSRLDIDLYHQQGYLLLDVLSLTDAALLRSNIDDILLPHGRQPTRERIFHASENQHFGDLVERYGEQSKHYYFHLLTDERFLSIQHIFHHETILDAIGQILGQPLIINNASLFAAEPGTTYNLGWHRDVIQIPEHEIDESGIYTPNRFHNSVQINLPLYHDETLWVVPGSHHRPNTTVEQAMFRGSKHYAPLDAVMPDALKVEIQPGQAVLYNNNLIHRGYAHSFPVPRRSLHLGYHGALRPPTWHFYLLDDSMFSDNYRARMSPQVRMMIDAYFACRRQYPRMKDTWSFCKPSKS